jgi:hypothetical protein
MWRSQNRAQDSLVVGEDLEGSTFEKTDGRCAHAGCKKQMTLADDKPDAGWAVVTIRRYGKQAERLSTAVVCPGHSVATAPRQTVFSFAHGKYEYGIG